jgi:hypothetical protein
MQIKHTPRPRLYLLVDLLGSACFVAALALIAVGFSNCAQAQAQTPTPTVSTQTVQSIQSILIDDSSQLTLARIELDLVKAQRTLQAKQSLCTDMLGKNDVEYQSAQKLQSDATTRLNTTLTALRGKAQCPDCYLDEEPGKNGEKRYVMKKPPTAQASTTPTSTKKEAKP